MKTLKTIGEVAVHILVLLAVGAGAFACGWVIWAVLSHVGTGTAALVLVVLLIVYLAFRGFRKAVRDLFKSG